MPDPALFFIVGAKDETGAVINAVTERMEKLRSQAKSTSAEFSGLGTVMREALGGIGLTFGIGEVVSKLKEAVTGALNFAEEIERASQKTGLAAGTLSTLHYAAVETGGDFETMTKAVAKMDKTIGAATEGDKKAESFLQKLGLNAKDLAGKSDGAEIAFKRFAQTLSSTENAIRRVELATGLLGRAGAESIPTLIDLGNNWDTFTAKAKASGNYLDGEMLQHLADMRKKLNDLTLSIQGASLSFTDGLTPGLSQFFDILTDGQGSLAFFSSAGERMAAVLNLMAAAAYGLGSGLESTFAIIERIAAMSPQAMITGLAKSLDAAADKDSAAADRYDAKAREFLEAVTAGPTATTGTAPKPKPGTGFGGIGDVSGGGANKAREAADKFAAAQRSDADASAKLSAAIAKAGYADQLEQLEFSHKEMLVSDADFYAQKATLQNAALQAEVDRAQSQQGDLNKQIGQLNSQKLSGSDAKDRDAKVLELKAKIKDLDAEIAKLTGEQAKNLSDEAASLYEMSLAKMKQSDDLGAELEAQRMSGTSARHKQSDDEYNVKRAGLVSNFGADSDEVKELDALHKVEAAKIEIAALDQQMAAIEASAKAAELKAQEQVLSGQISQMAGERAMQAARAAEVSQLKALQGQYAQYADAAGQAGIDAENKIAEAITQTQEAMKKQKVELASLAHSIIDPLIEGTGSLEKRWKQVGENIRKAVEQAADNQLIAMLMNAMGEGSGNFAGKGMVGKGSAGQGSGGLSGLFGSLLNFGMGKLSKNPAAGVASGTSPVTVQIINQSSTPVAGTATSGVGSGEGLTEMLTPHVISILLTDLENGGQVAQALGGNGQGGAGGN